MDQWLIDNWQIVMIGVLAIDKLVALSPSTWDDLLWTALKKAVFKLAGKDKDEPAK